MEEIGSWHTHTGNLSGTPSDQDMKAWLNGRDSLNRPLYIGLILTARAGPPRWSSSDVHAWVVRREGRSERAVCVPAAVAWA
jgi:hypothetical protein